MTVLDRIPARVSSLLAFREVRNPRHKGAILLAAVAFLIAGVGLSIRHHPEALVGLDWRPLLLVIAVGIPLTIGLNSLEFMLTGRLIGKAVPVTRALEITVIGTAANMLPLPGSALARLASLKAGGATLREATTAVLLVAAVWPGVAFVYSGLSILSAGAHKTGAAFLAAGLVILLAALFGVVRGKLGLRPALAAIAVKLGMVVTDAARLFLCLSAIGLDVSFAQASALTVSAVVGSAVSLVPAGLGVREAVAAALSPIVGLAAAAGFLAATVNRMLALMTIVPLASLLALRLRLRDGRDGLAPDRSAGT